MWAEHRKQWEGRDLTAHDVDGLTLTEHVEMGLLEQTEHHGKQDFHNLVKAEMNILTSGSRHGRRELALARATRLAQLARLWPAIEDVADELRRYRTMRHDEVKRVMVERLGLDWLNYLHDLEYSILESGQSYDRTWA